MKSLTIICILVNVSFLYSQQEAFVFLYIQNKLYNKPYTITDSVSKQAIFDNFYSKFKPYIVLDSVKQKDNNFYYYHSFLPKKINIIITDSQKNNVLIKRTSPHILSNVFSDIINKYENIGYPFAYVELDSIYLTQKNITACYIINLFTYFTYDSIDIIGKLLVKKSFIHSYLNIKPGKEYKERDVKQIDKHLALLPFYKISKASEIYFINNKAKPRIFLEKNNANQFYGLVGFGSSENRQFAINGDLYFSLNNMLKQADSWQIQWKKTDAFSQNLHLEANLPYIFSNPIGISGLFSLKKQDSSFLNLRYRIGLNFYIKGFNGLMLFAEKRQTNIFRIVLQDIAPVSATFAGISFSYKQLNNLILPTNGYSTVFSIAYGKKQLKRTNHLHQSIIEKFQNQSSTITGTIYSYAYLPIKRFLLFKFIVDGGYMNVAHFQNELFRNGGSKSIRGFDEESIYSVSYIINTIEQRFVVDKNTQIFAFVDKMYYKLLNGKYDDPWSWGAGAEINTSAGLFFVSYALGSQFNQPFNFKTGKIHFGYRNNF